MSLSDDEDDTASLLKDEVTVLDEPSCSYGQSNTPKSTSTGVKKKTTEKPLPDPFPLPAHFRPDVELGLESGKMSREAKKAFLSSVASAIFTFKKYPSGDEFTRVACEIVKRYPFLKPPDASPTVSSSSSHVYMYVKIM